MTVVDTSVWVDHLRSRVAGFSSLLSSGEVLIHPFVVGEIALGSLANRRTILSLLNNLPAAVAASDDEVLRFVESNSLFGLGLGYVDVHLLAATRLTSGATLWTKDKRLRAVAEQMGLATQP